MILPFRMSSVNEILRALSPATTGRRLKIRLWISSRARFAYASTMASCFSPSSNLRPSGVHSLTNVCFRCLTLPPSLIPNHRFRMTLVSKCLIGRALRRLEILHQASVMALESALVSFTVCGTISESVVSSTKGLTKSPTPEGSRGDIPLGTKFPVTASMERTSSIPVGKRLPAYPWYALMELGLSTKIYCVHSR